MRVDFSCSSSSVHPRPRRRSTSGTFSRPEAEGPEGGTDFRIYSFFLWLHTLKKSLHCQWCWFPVLPQGSSPQENLALPTVLTPSSSSGLFSLPEFRAFLTALEWLLTPSQCPGLQFITTSCQGPLSVRSSHPGLTLGFIPIYCWLLASGPRWRHTGCSWVSAAVGNGPHRL